MIDLAINLLMLIVIGLNIWSYLFDPNNALIASLSKRQLITLLLVFPVITLYLLSKGIYYSYLN